MNPSPTGERSLSELLSEMSNELSTLFRKEVELARTEIKEEVGTAGKAGAMFAGTAASGYLALLLLSMAAAWGLAEVMPTGAAFALVGGLHVVIAAVLFSVARRNLAALNPVPKRTMTTIKQDIDTAKSSIAAGAQGSSSPDSQPSNGWNRTSDSYSS